MARCVSDKVEEPARERDRLISPGDFQQCVATDDFLRFDKRSVGDRVGVALARDLHLERPGYSPSRVDERTFAPELVDEGPHTLHRPGVGGCIAAGFIVMIDRIFIRTFAFFVLEPDVSST